MTITANEALLALDALAATGAYSGLEDSYQFVKTAGRSPEWLMNQPKNRWFVHHNDRTYEVIAVSEAQAINNVRYRLYGQTSMDRLPPFEALCPHDIIVAAIGHEYTDEVGKAPIQPLSKIEVAERLHRMVMTSNTPTKQGYEQHELL